MLRDYQWQANLRILDINAIKSIPYTPTSHPFIERLIGTVRREYLDHLFFGMPVTCNENLLPLSTTTTRTEFISRKMEKRLCRQMENRGFSAHSLLTIHGILTARVSFIHGLLSELVIRHAQASSQPEAEVLQARCTVAELTVGSVLFADVGE